LSGRDPEFVVALPPPDHPTPQEPAPVAPPEAAPGDRGVSRINLRLPDDVKAKVEDAAARERISVNAWLVRAAVAALPSTGTGARAAAAGPAHRGAGTGQTFTGWVR
jgi:hypothetical protein